MLKQLKENREEIDRLSDICDCLSVSVNLMTASLDDLQRVWKKTEEALPNLEKINTMLLEFKGCISMARASLAESKNPVSTENSV